MGRSGEEAQPVGGVGIPISCFALGVAAVLRRARSGMPFRLVAEADHHAVGRPHGPLSAPPVTDPVAAAQAARRAGIVIVN